MPVVRRRADLVNLVDKHNPVLLRRLHRLFRHRVVRHQFLRLALFQRSSRVLHRHSPLRSGPTRPLHRQHLIQPAQHILPRPNVLHEHRRLASCRLVDLNLAIFQLTRAQQRAERVSCGLTRMQSREFIQESLFHRFAKLRFHRAPVPLLYERHRVLQQIPNDLIHVPPMEPDLRELRRLHFDKRCVHKLCQPPRDLRLTHARRPNHEHVFRHHFVPQLFRELLPPPPITKRDRHRALRIGLSHNEPIQLRHDLARRQLRQVPRPTRVLLTVISFRPTRTHTCLCRATSFTTRWRRCNRLTTARGSGAGSGGGFNSSGHFLLCFCGFNSSCRGRVSRLRRQRLSGCGGFAFCGVVTVFLIYFRCVAAFLSRFCVVFCIVL
mmetsp:Transcript_17040/g.37038  ORF Transcript_17040/g.37038 Transcript_17040/m.37038 type:complete len:380 (-) Transcript_17040:71-1210(-)